MPMPDISFRTNDSIEEIINKYSGMVYKIAFSQTKCKCDSDDVFQDVFLKYIRSNRRFENENHEKAWLIRVTINLCKKQRSSAWNRRTAPLDENILSEANEEMNDIYRVVAELPLKMRTVIHLFYYEDMSITQMSDVLHIRESTIRTQLTRARSALKEKLIGEYDYV